jgi:metallothionein
MSAADFPAGTVLTCTHEHCGCRLLVQQACDCASEPGATYTCSCGTPMVAVSAPQDSGQNSAQQDPGAGAQSPTMSM